MPEADKDHDQQRPERAQLARPWATVEDVAVPAAVGRAIWTPTLLGARPIL